MHNGSVPPNLIPVSSTLKSDNDLSPNIMTLCMACNVNHQEPAKLNNGSAIVDF